MRDLKLCIPLPVDGLPYYTEDSKQLIPQNIGGVLTARVLEGIHAIHRTGKPETVLVIPIPKGDYYTTSIAITRKWLEGLFEMLDQETTND